MKNLAVRYVDFARISNSKPLKCNYFGDSVVNNIETNFNKASDYSLFSGITKMGTECGYYGYKHTDEKAASVIAFSRSRVIICIRDATNKTWEQYSLK